MDALDRHGWTDAAAFEWLGVRFGIRTDSPDLMALAGSRLPPASVPSESDHVDVLFSLTGGGYASRGMRRHQILYEGFATITRTLDREALADAFDSALHVALAERATQWVFVHAGVVGWQGRAILLPGATFTGKTSLVAALLRAGAVFYSDDRAVIDAAGRVHPYAKPLSIREARTARQVPRSATSFGADVGSKPLPVGLVAFTRYREGASWSPQPLPPGQAMLAVLEHTSALRTRPRTVLATLRRTITGAASYRGVRGDATETAARLLALI